MVEVDGIAEPLGTSPIASRWSGGMAWEMRCAIKDWSQFVGTERLA